MNINLYLLYQTVFSDRTPPYMEPLEGYDAPTDAQLAVDLAALGMLSLLFQLFGVSEASRLLVRLWQTLKVKLVNLDGHPATGDGKHGDIFTVRLWE